MRVVIKRIDKSLPLPEYKTNGAVAFDLIVRETTIIKSHEVGRIPSNVIVKIPEGFMLFIRDRSSTAMKKGLLITAGVIDQDYCGDNDELLTQFYNFSDHDVTIERGDRVAQGVFVKIEKGDWDEVENMDSANRGGFGTTG